MPEIATHTFAGNNDLEFPVTNSMSSISTLTVFEAHFSEKLNIQISNWTQ